MGLRGVRLVVVAVAGLRLAGEPQPEAINPVLSKLDKNALTFKTISADLTRVTHNAAADFDTPEKGTMKLKKNGPRDIRVLMEFEPPYQKTVALAGDTAQIYNPKIQQVQEFDLGKNRALFDQYFLLGFGGSGKELAAAYTIASAGEETVAGVASAHLVLVPKSGEALKQLKKVDVWFGNQDGYPRQQKLSFPSGDTTVITYSNVKANGAIADGALKLKLPKNVQVVRPQK